MGRNTIKMSKNVYEPDELYRLYRTGSNETVDDGRFRLRRPWFDSRWTKLLLPEDRGIIENRCFNYLIVEPTALPPEGSHDVLVILHGLNEGSYGRMLPWACSFAHQLNIPVILFPLAFALVLPLRVVSAQRLVHVQVVNLHRIRIVRGRGR